MNGVTWIKGSWSGIGTAVSGGVGMDERDSRRPARRYVEERMVRVRCELALGEACGGESGGVRELEEELLEELAELELSFLTGDPEPCARRARSADTETSREAAPWH